MSNKERFLKEYSEALIDDHGAVFVGAGVSVGAGYPSWKDLLRDIGDELGVSSDDVHDLAALAQWSISASGSSARIRKVIRDQIGVTHPVPDALKVIARLPARHVWTTNYDRLIESAFSEIARPLDPISGQADLAIRVRPGAARLYKMHGSVDRLDDVVISTDDYELFRAKRGAFLPLLQAHLTSFSMLFVGLSFADPNLRHVLSLIRESFTDAPPEHFAIVRPPQRADFKSDDEFKARSRQHDLWSADLRRYGLLAVEIDDYAEVPLLLRELERRVAGRRVWISGSWPSFAPVSAPATSVPKLAERIGRYVGTMGLTLVSGAGATVGASALSGFLTALQVNNKWDLDQRLIARPFPQPLHGKEPKREHWTKLREELGRLSGSVVFVGGLKEIKGKLVGADGMLEELAIAEESGAYLIPVGASGGAAQIIAERLIGTPVTYPNGTPRRPSDDKLRELLSTRDEDELAALVATLLTERTGSSVPS